jgi:tRNA (guanine37-N1)-methyltransferase
VFCGLKVPEVLLSGDHALIERWRREKALEKAQRVRPELFGVAQGKE